jgi:hypothetical protein
MVLKSKQKIQALTAQQEKRYLLRREISEKRSQLKKQEKELKEDQDKLDAKLAPVFDQYEGRRKLSDGTIVERIKEDRADRICTKDMVGQTIQSGFSFVRYKEIAGG